MNKKNTIIPFIIFSALILCAVFLFIENKTKKVNEANGSMVSENDLSPSSQKFAEDKSAVQQNNISINSQQNFQTSETSDAGSTALRKMELQVPFIVQAPFANWSDPVFQNACEESSMVMTMGWLSGVKTISPQQAQKRIQEIVSWEEKNFGYSEDTNVFDVQKIFQQYFHKQVSVMENISLQDIIDQLAQGNLVLVPAFGRVLGNPNYTAPGPIAHMLVLTGYDPSLHLFIVNDSGTKRGQEYRYDEQILYQAIWEYPSGRGPLNPPQKGKQVKAMVVVSRN